MGYGNRSVSIMSRLGDERYWSRGSKTGRYKRLRPFSTVSRPNLGASLPLVHLLPAAFSENAKRPGREARHLLLK